jgi:hypothetical protein
MGPARCVGYALPDGSANFAWINHHWDYGFE